MIILKGFLNAAIISLLYMMYRHGNENDIQMFWLCAIGATHFIRRLYVVSKTT